MRAVIAFASAFTLALTLVRALASDALAGLVLDIPNERSLHVRPTPRTGGIGLFLAASIAWFALGSGAMALVAGLAGVLAAIFLVDDVRGLPVRVRLVVQLAAAGAFVLATGPYPWPLLLLPLLVVGIVWSANLYNFMDGSNGLAGGMALFGFAAYAIAAARGEAADIALVAAIVAGAAAGFLVWNFDPASIFLGDAGSIPLGFLAAMMGVEGWSRGIWPFWFPVLVFSPFVVDACLTLLQRAMRGERLSEAHKSHYYQRLVRMGWSHKKLAVAEYALMAAVAATAITFRTSTSVVVVALLALWTVAYAAIAVTIDRRWRAYGPR